MPVKKPGGLEVDFSGVESGGSRHVEDGEYLAQVVSVEQQEGESSGQPYLAWKWKIIEEGDAKNATVYDNTSLTPQALWRLRNLLESIGEEVPDGRMRLVLDKYVGRKCRIEVTNETYQGKQKPRVTAYLGAAKAKAKAKPETSDDDGDDDDKPQVKKGARVKFKDEDGNVYKGKVLSIEDEVVTIDVDGEEWQVELDQITVL